MSDPKKHHALFFTERGAGPDDVILWTQPLDAIVDKGESIAPRTLALRVGPADDFPLMVSRAGGYQMDETTVRALHAEFGAWLDAPRLAARQSAEVVTDGWRDISTSGEQQVHQREVGEFTLACWDGGSGWAWAVEWGDNDIAEGEAALTREDNDTADAWAAALPRAKAACEAAARKAGIAVAAPAAGEASP